MSVSVRANSGASSSVGYQLMFMSAGKAQLPWRTREHSDATVSYLNSSEFHFPSPSNCRYKRGDSSMTHNCDCTLDSPEKQLQVPVTFKLVVSDSLQNKLIGVRQSLLQILCANILCSHYFIILFIITNIIFWYIKSQPQSFLLAAQN